MPILSGKWKKKIDSTEYMHFFVCFAMASDCTYIRIGLQNQLNESEKLDYHWLIIIQTDNPPLECFDILSSSIDAPTLDIHRLH